MELMNTFCMGILLFVALCMVFAVILGLTPVYIKSIRGKTSTITTATTKSPGRTIAMITINDTTVSLDNITSLGIAYLKPASNRTAEESGLVDQFENDYKNLMRQRLETDDTIATATINNVTRIVDTGNKRLYYKYYSLRMSCEAQIVFDGIIQVNESAIAETIRGSNLVSTLSGTSYVIVTSNAQCGINQVSYENTTTTTTPSTTPFHNSTHSSNGTTENYNTSSTSWTSEPTETSDTYIITTKDYFSGLYDSSTTAPILEE